MGVSTRKVKGHTFPTLGVSSTARAFAILLSFVVRGSREEGAEIGSLLRFPECLSFSVLSSAPFSWNQEIQQASEKL
jgi:hypothetical protein